MRLGPLFAYAQGSCAGIGWGRFGDGGCPRVQIRWRPLGGPPFSEGRSRSPGYGRVQIGRIVLRWWRR